MRNVRLEWVTADMDGCYGQRALEGCMRARMDPIWETLYAVEHAVWGHRTYVREAEIPLNSEASLIVEDEPK